MSESQAIDRPRVWWKELIKRRRIRLFDAALVGGPTHRDYLVQLGMPAGQIALGYNAVDNDYFADDAGIWREHPSSRSGLAARSLFPPVCRFVPEKNLVRLIEAFAATAQSGCEHRPGTWSSAATGPRAARSRPSDREQRLRAGDPPARLPPGR